MYRKRYKPPVKEILLIVNEATGIISVYFEVDSKIIKHMQKLKRQLNARYNPYPPHWELPLTGKETLINYFRNKGYYVKVERKLEFPEGVFEVLGNCPNCGCYQYYGQDGKCHKCR